MKTSPVKQSRQAEPASSGAPSDRDVVRIPDARRGPSATVIAIAAAVVVALFLGAVLGYAWERRAVADQRDQVVAALVAARRAQDVADGAAAQVGVLAPQVAGLQNDLRQARQAAAVLRASRHELRRGLVDAGRQRAAMADQLAASRAVARHLNGTQLSDGSYVGKISAVAASQTPAIIVFDHGVWLSGSAAQSAAVKDGVIGPNQSWRHRYYCRDRDVQWRILQVAPGARFILRNAGGRPGRHAVGIGQLQRVFERHSPWAQRIRHDPFSVVIEAGRVIRVVQLRYP